MRATWLALQVGHYPPGTSKWNRTEHRMVCHVTQDWRGKPPTSRLATVELAAATTTRTGLTVRCEPDERRQAKGRRVTDQDRAAPNVGTDPWHPGWNDISKPRTKQ